MSQKISLVGTVTVGPKGQVVIPADCRQKMDVMPGDKLVALYIEEKHAVSFITEARAQELINKMGENVAALQESLEK